MVNVEGRNIIVNNDSEWISLSEYLESLGKVWRAGQLPTRWYPQYRPYPYVISIENEYISCNSDIINGCQYSDLFNMELRKTDLGTVILTIDNMGIIIDGKNHMRSKIGNVITNIWEIFNRRRMIKLNSHGLFSNDEIKLYQKDGEILLYNTIGGKCIITKYGFDEFEQTVVENWKPLESILLKSKEIDIPLPF